jgi:hypothetical protein
MRAMQRPIHPRSVCARRSLLAILMLGMLAAAPAPHAAQTSFSIRITPRAAALIAELRRGVPPAHVLAQLPEAGSAVAFAQACHAAGADALITTTAHSVQRVCM